MNEVQCPVCNQDYLKELGFTAERDKRVIFCPECESSWPIDADYFRDTNFVTLSDYCDEKGTNYDWDCFLIGDYIQRNGVR